MPHYVGLILATICHAEKLIPALVDLHSGGFRVEDLCAIGGCEAMSQAADTIQNLESKYNYMGTLFSDTGSFISQIGSTAIIGSQGTLKSSLQKRCNWQKQQGIPPTNNRLDDIFTRLMENDGNGCVKLTVAAHDYAQIVSAAQILLRYSDRSVHTHEFMKSKSNSVDMPVFNVANLPGPTHSDG